MSNFDILFILHIIDIFITFNFSQTSGKADIWEDDRAVVSWFETPSNKSQLSNYIASKRATTLASQVSEKLTELSSICGEKKDAVKLAVAGMSSGDRAALLKALQDNA